MNKEKFKIILKWIILAIGISICLIVMIYSLLFIILNLFDNPYDKSCKEIGYDKMVNFGEIHYCVNETEEVKVSVSNCGLGRCDLYVFK